MDRLIDISSDLEKWFWDNQLSMMLWPANCLLSGIIFTKSVLQVYLETLSSRVIVCSTNLTWRCLAVCHISWEHQCNLWMMEFIPSKWRSISNQCKWVVTKELLLQWKEWVQNLTLLLDYKLGKNSSMN